MQLQRHDAVGPHALSAQPRRNLARTRHQLGVAHLCTPPLERHRVRRARGLRRQQVVDALASREGRGRLVEGPLHALRLRTW
eukprot:1012264-Prymnesium_polylepis.1